MRLKLAVLLIVTLVASGCLSDSNSSLPEEETPVDEDMLDEDPEDQQEEASDTSGSSNTIYFTGSGFQPSSLTVEQGETVTWINNASRSMWVASDRHPVHSDYAGTSLNEHCGTDASAFDQCSTGERYSFTFEKTGSWGYHNHEPFVRGGTVTVE